MPGKRRSASRVVRVEVGPRNTSWLHGRGLPAVLDELQVPRMWDWRPGRKGELCCPSDRLDDVLAWLEHRDGRVVELLAVDR